MSIEGKLTAAQEALMLSNLGTTLDVTTAAVKGHYKKLLGGDFAVGEDMANIHIGDNHPMPPVPAAATGWLPGLAKLALGAGLIATGAGIPAGAYMIADALKAKPPAAVQQPIKIPVDLRDFNLELVP